MICCCQGLSALLPGLELALTFDTDPALAGLDLALSVDNDPELCNEDLKLLLRTCGLSSFGVEPLMP